MPRIVFFTIALTHLGWIAPAGAQPPDDPESAGSASGGSQGEAATEEGALTDDAAQPQSAEPETAEESETDAVDQAARIMFVDGSRAYADADYERALDRFERAYELSQRPELLFNIGQSADRLRRTARAVEAFEGFLAQVPVHQKRNEVEQRLVVLRAEIANAEAADAERERVTSELEAERVARREAEEAGSPIGLILGIVAGVVVIGAAVGIAVWAANRPTEVNTGTRIEALARW